MSTRRLAAWLACAVALALVFAAYLRPEAMMTLALQVWNCF
jgi:hypothetical protein